MRLSFLDAVKLYFTAIYLFILILYFVLGYYAFRFILQILVLEFLVFVMVWGGHGLSGGWEWVFGDCRSMGRRFEPHH